MGHADRSGCPGTAAHSLLVSGAPTVHGDRLYVFTNNGWLLCLNSITGDIVWRISYPSEFGTPPGNWGFCDRPLVDGEKLIRAPGGTQATVVLPDKRTGKVLWKKLLDTRTKPICGDVAGGNRRPEAICRVS